MRAAEWARRLAGLGDREPIQPLSRGATLSGALALSLLLIGTYIAAGGASYRPERVADPCEQRAWRSPQGLQEILDQIALSAADGAACRLGVSREELVLALSSAKSRRAFVREHRLSDEQVDETVRAGMRRAVNDAREAGAIGSVEEFILQRAIDSAPIDFVLDRLGRP